MQGAKEQVERVSEEDTIEGLAHHVASLLEDEPDLMVVWGSGGTLRRMGEHLGLNLTLLGIDVQHGTTVHNDLNGKHRSSTSSAPTSMKTACALFLLLLSPMGGQGLYRARESATLPDVLRLIGHSNILGVATPSKLIGLESVRIDTGDESLDAEFQAKRFIKNPPRFQNHPTSSRRRFVAFNKRSCGPIL